MKVLFAVSNEEISENIVKKYQREYKEIISYKNVYYFNAILKELQKDKTYDRIVISEDLENFTSNQYDQIDKFIFEKLDSISDEASNYQGDNIPIILICADRRTKSEQMLIKLFGISIYDALLGPDRNIDELCKLINKPRSKKEAKIYYKIDSEDVNYKPENENDVSEVEIQNILAHYKRLGKNEEKYLESFDNIASQYNDVQLRIICKFLPLNVRAVLEEKSPKYQKVMSFNSKVTDKLRKGKHNEEANGTSEKLLKTVNTKETLLSKPVVIPNAVNLQNTKKLTKPKPVEENKEEEDPLKQIEREINTYVKNENGFVQTQQTKTTKQEENLRIAETEEVESKPAPKRGRGRPRKNPLPEEDAPKKKRGRPKKNTEDENQLQIQDEEESNNARYRRNNKTRRKFSNARIRRRTRRKYSNARTRRKSRRTRNERNNRTKRKRNKTNKYNRTNIKNRTNNKHRNRHIIIINRKQEISMFCRNKQKWNIIYSKQCSTNIINTWNFNSNIRLNTK